MSCGLGPIYGVPKLVQTLQKMVTDSYERGGVACHKKNPQNLISGQLQHTPHIQCVIDPTKYESVYEGGV